MPTRDPVGERGPRDATAARLLTTGDGHVEVAHEALLREWPRLQGWLAEDAAGRGCGCTSSARRATGRPGREPGDLYRGARLATALEWSAEHPVELNESERAFLDAGRHASRADVERQRRTNRRLRGLLAGTAGLLVVALAAGGLAFVQGQRAPRTSRVATPQQAGVAGGQPAPRSPGAGGLAWRALPGS